MNGSEEKSEQEHKQKTLFEHIEVALFFCSSVLTRASLLALAKIYILELSASYNSGKRGL